MEAPKEQSTKGPCVMDIDVGLRRRLCRRWPRQRRGEMQICTCEAPLGRSSLSEGDTFVRQSKNFTLREIHGGKGLCEGP